MAKFNADDQQSMVEPIEITIDGNTYKIEKDHPQKKVTVPESASSSEIDAGSVAGSRDPWS